ncbi:MAG: sigma-70 family RNA polymerase sigma factor [Planctomycetes bacterium]|nr:sigma-70 family RNA polymerase sigma factor [Planctomycetota bacterium]
MTSRTPAEEMQLRAAALRGDEAAWTALVEASFDVVWATARRHVRGDRGLAEEVVQEAWMTAVKKLARFDPARGPFAAWVCGLARQHARNARRKAARAELRERPLHTELAEVVHAAAPTTSAETLARIWSALPERDRRVLRARFEEHRSIAEIAALFSASEKAIESLLARARERFRRLWIREEHR